MNTRKYTCKVNNANSNPKNKSLKCTIPQQVIYSLDIVEGDTIKWIINEDDDKITVTVEKLIL